MSIIYNGTNIENITYNGTTLDTVNYNNTEVYVSTRTLTVNKNSNIKNISINNTRYTSNKTLSIKPGTSVTLDCNLKSNTTSGNITTTYSFVNWTGYTTNTSKSFTFTMPNSDITYTANGTYSSTMNWPSSGDISESIFLEALNSNASNKFNTSLVGRYVTLTESSSTHNWIIVRVNSDSYDLWYAGSIGTARWKGGDNDRYWVNQPLTANSGYYGYDNPRHLSHQYKSKLSSNIQAKLKTGLNVNCGSDTVVILSYKQLGGEGTRYTDNNEYIPYFNRDERRSIGTSSNYSRYWTTSVNSTTSNSICVVWERGVFVSETYEYSRGVVPAIRVG